VNLSAARQRCGNFLREPPRLRANVPTVERVPAALLSLPIADDPNRYQGLPIGAALGRAAGVRMSVGCGSS
jgi:hypothetical protein